MLPKWLFLTCSGFLFPLMAQHPCAVHKAQTHAQLSHLSSVPGTENYNVHYVHLDVQVERSSNGIFGKATTHFTVNSTQLNDYIFELIAPHTIDSIRLNGLPAGFTRNGNMVTAILPTPLSQGAQGVAEVWYGGTPPNGGFFNGISNGTSPSWGNQVTWTLSQPFGARDWWPVKQDLQDKIDSVRVWITTDTSNKAGSNGLLENITPLNGGKHRFEWVHRHPIAYYLLSIAVAQYIEYNFNVSVSPILSVPIINYIYNNPGTLPNFQTDIDETGNMLLFFNSIFGMYPYADEKYGHCMAPFSGGMEHQTMTTQGFFNRDLTAHELGHQWFGDHVTCATWKDIWVNEGFASYSEYLYAQSVSQTAATQWMASAHQNITSAAGGSVYVDDTTNENRIFSGRLTYDKGGAILHTLRAIINNDSLYFLGFRQFLQQFGGGNARGVDVQQVMEQVSGQNLQTFFQQWYFGEGFPILEIRWNSGGPGLLLNIQQVGSAPNSVSAFSYPLELVLQRTGLPDTTVRVAMQSPQQFFHVPVAGVVSGIVVDPLRWVIKRVNLLEKDLTLSLEHAEETRFMAYPNPTSSEVWIPAATGPATLTNMTGQEVWKGDLAPERPLNLGSLPMGTYFLHFFHQQKPHTLRLVRI